MNVSSDISNKSRQSFRESERDTYRVARVIFVGHPFSDRGPPIFQYEAFGILLALTFAVSTLSCGLSDAMLPVKIDLDPLFNSRSNGGLWTPGTSGNVLAKPFLDKREGNKHSYISDSEEKTDDPYKVGKTCTYSFLYCNSANLIYQTEK